ncbi:MerR family transcriptional regulator [Glycomyces sp. YM15]|uniref:MerR family transcriptional regulator n=1 Tax=Glycomyces sp. YM15 TaxID=2800446 RepID=UPI001965BD62|nr:MerR family transcriptional regulator [Glycomyces sp. YM15]
MSDHPPPSAARDLTVGRAAALLGVSVKTLHHWDDIGLARPSGRSGTGYRLYADADVARLHRVLVYRELGFPLAAIADLLDDPAADARAHLRRQRTQVAERMDRLRHMAGGIDRLLEALERGLPLSAEEQLAIFGEDWQPGWVEEAAERWGAGPQWTQYAERVAEKTPEEWKAVAAATEALNADLAAAAHGGVAHGSVAANQLAERHRALMSTYFECTHAMQVCMGRMFTEDPRFAANFDGIEPGLASWLREAIDANARANGVDPDTAVWT